jgi:hypothetical protein
MRAGRTRALTGVASQPATFYIGGVNGGVWKTTDAGATWHSLWDAQPQPARSARSPWRLEPQYCLRGQRRRPARPDLSTGDGVYKSTDAGKTWTHLGLRDGQQIGQIAIDPKNPDIVFVAVTGHPYGPNKERGLYRHRRRQDLQERALSSTTDRRVRSPDRPATIRRSSSQACGSAGRSVGERRLHRRRRRYVPLHRRRRDLHES